MSLPAADSVPSLPATPRWVHAWAVLTAVAVFLLIALGGLVTSLRVGMADTAPVRAPWYMLAISWQETVRERGLGYLIEHGHRQLGWIVGVMTILLAGAIAWRDRRVWLRWLGVAALAAVSIQGVLGMLRVHLESAGMGLEFAMVHGVFAQLVFCTIAAVALFTSRGWQNAVPVDWDEAGRFRRLCWMTVILLLMQLPVGIVLRQLGMGRLGVILVGHLFLAVAVANHILMLTVRIHCSEAVRGLFNGTALILAVLLISQIGLGIGAWWLGAGVGAMDPRPINVVRATLATAHVGSGALLLAAVVLLALRSHRHLAATRPALLPLAATEGAA